MSIIATRVTSSHFLVDRARKATFWRASPLTKHRGRLPFYGIKGGSFMTKSLQSILPPLSFLFSIDTKYKRIMRN